MALDFLKSALKKGVGLAAGGDIGLGGGPATSRTGGVSFGNFASGGGKFNPFANATGQVRNSTTVMVIGAVMIGPALLLKPKKRGRK